MKTPTGLRIPRSVATKHEKAIRSALGVSTVRLWEERQDREGEGMEVMAGSSLSSPLSSLTEADISALMTAEDELSQTREWSRIFPAASSETDYLQFWSSASHLDTLLHAWELKYGASQASRQQGREFLRDFWRTHSVSI